MSETELKSRAPEKRDFFRINQDVLFEVHLVDSYAADNSAPESHFDDSPALTLLNQLRKIDKDNQQILGLIKDKNRLLTDYLQSLNNKIDLVTRFCLFSQQADSADQATTRINLSEGGIAYTSNRAVYKGNFLVLRLIFLPSYVHVVTFAKVVRCSSKENEHQVAARFHRIQDKDRQEIARHILKAQVQLRKN